MPRSSISRGRGPLRRPAVALAALALVVVTPIVAGGGELRSIAFESSAVDRTMRYDVLVPAGYHESTEHYPVLYLLHGWGGDLTVWREDNRADFYAGLFGGLIVVMPDAGNSWYVNWAASSDGRKNRWEDYLVRDLIPHVYLDCGTDDTLMVLTRELAGRLLDKGVPFDFMQAGGGHDSEYWVRAAGHLMAIQYEVMQRALGHRPVG